MTARIIRPLNVVSLIGVAALVVGLAGCKAMGPQMASDTPVPQDSSAALIMYTSDQPYVTAESAYHVGYVLAHGETFAGSFDELATTLVDEKIVAKHWQHSPNQALRRGEVAFVVCRACRIGTGVNWLATGLGRYALRELQYRDIVGGGGEYGLMSGGEFVGVVNRAEQYLRQMNRAPAEVELGSPEG